jgi:hypothetical protein
MAAFTTIAAGVGLAATGATTGMSFAQARKQRKLQQQAEDKASQMMAEARKKLEVNYYDQLAIQKEPYELEREALISAGAQAIEAGKESERGAAAVAGRVQMAQQQGQREIASAMGQEMLGLEKLSAQEDARLRDIGVQLDLGEVEGAQMAAAQSAEAANVATQQAVQGVISMGQQAAAMAPLYARNRGAEKTALGGMGMSSEDFSTFGNVADYKGSKFGSSIEGGSNLDFGTIGGMTNSEYNRFLRALTPEQKQMLFMNPKFQQKYQQSSQFMNPFFF